METARWARLKELFHAARELTLADRAHFLEKNCAGDAELREQVLALLDSAENEQENSSGPTVVADALPRLGGAGTSDFPKAASLGESAGSRVGPYKLLEEIGEGGFGTVFMAEQERPVRRRVALKIIKLGMDTRRFVARFEAERQALALMDHPNIAHVLDGGATEGGRPYFVMELVRGRPITEYCDEHRLTVRQRLELFQSVCNAVQHAHQKGVIHRDIKPSNLLVSTVDDRPLVKVIDFGVSKTTGQQLTDKTLFTGFQQMIGTPAYMSPEQAAGSVDLDTRADVYSLGVLLYELLTGSPPFETDRLRSAGSDWPRVIREVEPPRPSTRFSALTQAQPRSDARPFADLDARGKPGSSEAMQFPRGATPANGSRGNSSAATLAASRRTDPRQLVRAIRGELDWIVMKALEKDRTRRYESPSALAADVERFLRGEPVSVGRPSRWYRVRKLAMRHRWLFIAAGTVFLTLCLGIAGTTVGLFSAWKSQAIAESKERLAKAESQKSEQIAEFLRQMLGGLESGVALGKDTALLREILNRAAARVDVELLDQPEAAVALRTTIGDMFRQIGDAATAEPFLLSALDVSRSVLGNDAPQTAETLVALAALRWDQVRVPEAEKAIEEALRIYRKAEQPRLKEIGRTLCVHSKYLYHLQRLDDAGRAGQEGLAILESQFGGDSLPVADARAALAAVMNARHNLAAAESLHRQALETRRRHLGSRHPDVAKSLTSLADLALLRQSPEEALPLAREAADIAREVFRDAPAELGYVLGVHSNAMGFSPRAADWVAASRERLDLLLRNGGGGKDIEAARAYYEYGTALRVADDLDASEAALRCAVEIAAANPAFSALDRAEFLGLLGFVLGQQAGKRWQCDFVAAQRFAAESEAVLRAALDGLSAVSPAQPLADARIEAGLGALLTMIATQQRQRGECTEALCSARQSADYLERVLNVFGKEAPDDPVVVIHQSSFGRALAAVADASEAAARGCNGSPPPSDSIELLEFALQYCRRSETVLTEACESTRSQRLLGEALRLRRLRSCYQNLAELHEIWERISPGQGHSALAAAFRSRSEEEHLEQE